MKDRHEIQMDKLKIKKLELTIHDEKLKLQKKGTSKKTKTELSKKLHGLEQDLKKAKEKLAQDEQQLKTDEMNAGKK